MWGTIARMRLRADLPDEYLRGQFDALNMGRMPGWIRTEFFRSDDDPLEIWMVAMFKDEESYRANADSTSQHAVYMTLRACLEGDPEWHDVDEYASRYTPGYPEQTE